MEKSEKKINKETEISNTHVPDKVYAYSLQVRHALYELLDCTGNDIVSIEVFDDIAIEKDDGSTKAIQLKSVLSSNNPISDRATDLWKTFYNWLLSINKEELDADNTSFKLFIAAQRKGNIANYFSDANNIESAEEAWYKAKLEFYDETANEKNLGDQYALYIRNFFNLKNKSSACKIIQKFTLQTIDDKHTTFLYNSFRDKTLVHDDLIENVFIYMLGWIDKRTAELVEAGKPMFISYKEYKAQIIAISREFNQNLSLKELVPRPTNEEIQKEYHALRKYIEQLDFVECDYTDKLEAISDYLRASTNRTLWAKRGDISEISLSNYEEVLLSKWNAKKKIISITEKKLTSIEQGHLLYFRCKENNISIDHISVPDFFTPGCYHALSDDLAIGWHPKYEELFKMGCENDEQT